MIIIVYMIAFILESTVVLLRLGAHCGMDKLCFVQELKVNQTNNKQETYNKNNKQPNEPMGPGA